MPTEYFLLLLPPLCVMDRIPLVLRWKQEGMWHLLQCFEEGKLTPFPEDNKVRSFPNNDDDKRNCHSAKRYKQKDKMKQRSECYG